MIDFIQVQKESLPSFLPPICGSVLNHVKLILDKSFFRLKVSLKALNLYCDRKVTGSRRGEMHQLEGGDVKLFCLFRLERSYKTCPGA